MKSISKIMAIIAMNCVVSLCASESQKSMMLQNVAVGAAAGATEVLGFGQVASYAANQMIQGRALVLRDSYRGCAANVAGMAPITAVQVAGTKKGEELVKEWQNGAELSDMQKVGVATCAGAASGIVATPSEAIPVHMQQPENKGKTTMQVIRELGPRGAMRGCVPTAGRDGIFTAGYMSMNNICVEKAKNIVGDNYAAPVLGGITAGVIVAVATQPLAVVKTKMQSDPKKMYYPTALSTASSVLRTDGIRGLYRGLPARGARIIVAIPVLGAATKCYTELISQK